MPFERATHTLAELEENLARACRKPHKDVHRGRVVISPSAFETEGRETNLCISKFSFLDMTGSIFVGPWCMLGARCRVYTHDHLHQGRDPLLETQEREGVLWQDKIIGADVWIHDAALVLYQVTHIPNGVVLGAGAVLTKNPGPYEIWAGVPAKKVGERKDITQEQISEMIREKGRFLIPEKLRETGRVY